jgi:CubicO group peptidase (beta-lactamase class C family)
MRALVFFITFFALLTSAADGRQAQPAAQAVGFDALVSLVEKKMTEYGVPGVAFGVVKNGEVRTRAFGVTNLDNPQPVTADTVFPLASITKTIVATAVMRLVEQGKLDLDAPVRRYLPSFRVQDEAMSRDVAVWHLLTHTPGWEGQLTSEDRGPLTLANFVDTTMRDLPPLAPPGEVWSYNNAGFSLAGRLLEVVTGQTIHDALRTLVFEPVGLTRAFTRNEDMVTWPFSVSHRGPAGKVTVSRPLSRTSSVAAGGASMSLNDILRYAQFHLGDGNGADGKRVLSPASLELMRRPRVPKHGTDDEMGMGWHLRRLSGVMTAAHGGTLGHILLLELVPERNFALAVLTNHSDGWRLIQDVEREALRTLENLALSPTHAIGHRGLNETMPDVPLLGVQPDAAPFLGTYRRPPSGSNAVRLENGQLRLDSNAIAFYAPDRAIVTSGASRGNPVEFIRDASGSVRWVRYIGRIARRE